MKFNLTLILIILFIFIQNAFGFNLKYNRYSDTLRIENDLKIITKTKQSRNYQNIETLNFVAQYIFNEFSKTCDTVYFQTFIVDGKEYKNVIGTIGQKNKEKIVIGAHYDVAGEQEGADDNASGIVGLLELARLITKDTLCYKIEFVAYTLEEPPFFKTEKMGSFIHAKSLFDNGEKIKGMICLEMIGYFNNMRNSQNYPIKLLKLFYGKKGDYITVVRKFGGGKFAKQFKRIMKRICLIKTKSFKAPKSLPGVDFSDHLNYWKFGYSAVMITNTAFYRNNNYHTKADKIETLDLKKMSLVIDEIFLSLKKLK